MIKLTFTTPQRKIIRFSIEGKLVKYFDDNWKDGLQIYPFNRLLVKKLTLSRKSSLSAMGLLIIEANQGTNLEQYENCRTEEDIAGIIRADCKLKGLREI